LTGTATAPGLWGFGLHEPRSPAITSARIPRRCDSGNPNEHRPAKIDHRTPGRIGSCMIGGAAKIEPTAKPAATIAVLIVAPIIF
jgi:hypothetical protein